MHLIIWHEPNDTNTSSKRNIKQNMQCHGSFWIHSKNQVYRIILTKCAEKIKPWKHRVSNDWQEILCITCRLWYILGSKKKRCILFYRESYVDDLNNIFGELVTRNNFVFVVKVRQLTIAVVKFSVQSVLF